MLSKSKIKEINIALRGIPLQDRRETLNLTIDYFESLAQQARCRYHIGDSVSFNSRSGKTITGTIKRINTKTLTLESCSGSGSSEWRVAFSLINE